MLTTLSFGDEAPYCLDMVPSIVELPETDGHGFWAVGTDDWGNIISYDHCESREEAEEFIRDELPGRGIVMTDNELYNALNMGEEVYA